MSSRRQESGAIRYREPRRQLEKETGYLPLPNAVLYGLPWLSSPAYRTYIGILGLDWDGKASVYWGKARLATILDLPWRTLQDHLAELAWFRLITREERERDTSVLWIEELPDCVYKLALHRRSIIQARSRESWPAGPGGFLDTFREWAARVDPAAYEEFLQFEQLAREWKQKRKKALR